MSVSRSERRPPGRARRLALAAGIAAALSEGAPVASAWETAGEPAALGTTLERGALIEAVLERNPTLEAARQAWQAALQRVPQATSLDDPMLSYSLAPLSIAADAAGYGHVVRVSQHLPAPGTRCAWGTGSPCSGRGVASRRSCACSRRSRRCPRSGTS